MTLGLRHLYYGSEAQCIRFKLGQRGGWILNLGLKILPEMVNGRDCMDSSRSICS